MPSFSELYYNSIGNKTLNPELTMQFNAGTSYRFFKNSLHVSIDGYYNRIENKILAIPTKNLFVWSIQNIGKVAVYGVDVLLKKIWKLHTNLEVSASMNYSYQKIVDISDVKSSTYKNQLAYFPLHTVQSEISLWMFNKIGLYVSNSNLTNRYVLNENIPTNALKGFSIYDAALSYRTNRETKNSVKFSFTIKNCFNTPYQYISYFVMPGRNYLITMSYAFN
jgi:outer membrane cobalamin receptor